MLGGRQGTALAHQPNGPDWLVSLPPLGWRLAHPPLRSFASDRDERPHDRGGPGGDGRETRDAILRSKVTVRSFVPFGVAVCMIWHAC